MRRFIRINDKKTALSQHCRNGGFARRHASRKPKQRNTLVFGNDFCVKTICSFAVHRVGSFLRFFMIMLYFVSNQLCPHSTSALSGTRSFTTLLMQSESKAFTHSVSSSGVSIITA